nr:MAG TPA: large terminase [Caudoviricetes sp.]
MRIKTLSDKQLQIFDFAVDACDTLICDGAVRSGKTLIMSFVFIFWAMSNFDKTSFGICGKTVTSAEKNIIKPLQQLEQPYYAMSYKISNRMLTVRNGRKENYFYIFGGKDESSYTLIQGSTLAGVLFDEVALMPQSFVDQAIARTLSFHNAKIWFNCNPESPSHWFYNEWLTNPERKFKHLHFLMNDNPILTEKEINRAENLYSGVFYDRYIKGLWVRAEGIIFPEFANNPKPWIISSEEVPKEFRAVEVGFDIGGNGSAYALTCTGQGYDGIQYKLKAEKRQAEEMTMHDIERFVCDFCEQCERLYGVNIDMINCDHVAVIVNTINDNTKYRACLTYKPPLEDRVFLYSKLFANHKVKFADGMCDDLIDEMQNLVFDDKNDRAIPLDNGTMQIDTWDSNIYSESGYWAYIEG